MVFKMKDLSQKIHDRGVDELAMRLTCRPHDAVLKHVQYKTPYHSGELDVVKIYKGVAHIYEVKIHHSILKREQAKEQLKRVTEAFPNWNVRLIYYPLDARQRIIYL